MTTSSLLAAVRTHLRWMATRPDDDGLDAHRVSEMAWQAAVGFNDDAVGAAIDRLVETGDLRVLLDRLADAPTGPLRTRPADLWFAAYATAWRRADYRGCTRIVREAGDQLPEWTRQALRTAAETVRAGVRS